MQRRQALKSNARQCSQRVRQPSRRSWACSLQTSWRNSSSETSSGLPRSRQLQRRRRPRLPVRISSSRRAPRLADTGAVLWQTMRNAAVAAGGIADGRGIAASLMLGASAVQIGTGFLRCPEAEIHPAWATALAKAMPEDTCLTRAFSGRAGRSLVTGYVRAAVSPDAPHPAPYPVQRGLTAGMRRQAQDEGDIQRMQAWAGQSARLARAEPAGDVVRSLWQEAYALLRGV